MPRPGTPRELRKQTIDCLLIVRKVLLQHPGVLHPPMGSAAWHTFGESVVRLSGSTLEHSHGLAVQDGYATEVAVAIDDPQGETVLVLDKPVRGGGVRLLGGQAAAEREDPKDPPLEGPSLRDAVQGLPERLSLLRGVRGAHPLARAVAASATASHQQAQSADRSRG